MKHKPPIAYTSRTYTRSSKWPSLQKHLKSSVCATCNMKEKKIYNFCGCEVVLRAYEEADELSDKYIDRAEKKLVEIIEKEFRVPSKKEVKEDLLGKDYDRGCADGFRNGFVWAIIWCATIMILLISFRVLFL